MHKSSFNLLNLSENSYYIVVGEYGMRQDTLIAFSDTLSVQTRTQYRSRTRIR